MSAEPAASKVRRYAQESDQRAGVTDIVNEPATPAAAVAVVGAGTMGSGIALCAVSAALPTLLTDTHAHALKQALARITSSCERAVANGKITASERDQRLSLLSVSPDPAAIGQADVVIEAVFEDLKVKQDVFRSIARIAQPDAILASNTSTLDLDRIAAVVAQPERVIGLHFFSPAHVMRLLEVVRGERTSISTIARAMAFAQQLGKTAVLARVCDGFIGNRTFEEYLRQAYFFLDEGALPAQVDQALERWGMALGPFAVMDLAGNDIGWAIRRRRATEQPHRPYSKLPDRVCELGRLGQKTGAGYYRYGTEGKRRVDPEVESLVRSHADGLGLARRTLSDQEIVARCVLALVNEGARLLAERIAQRGSDVDVVWRNGYGFPAERGGPFYYADELGLDQVLERMARFRRGYQGHLWEPAPLLLDCARGGGRLSDIGWRSY